MFDLFRDSAKETIAIAFLSLIIVLRFNGIY